MSRVCKETLRQQIDRLASKGSPELGLGMTLNEEFQLEAYRMLLAKLSTCRNCNRETTVEDIEYNQCGFCGCDL